MSESQAIKKYPHFLHSEIDNGKPESSFFHIIPVPYEHSVSYGSGTRLGPGAILQASAQLEVLDGKSKPAELGIYTADSIECTGEPEYIIDRISNAVQNTLSDQKFPIVLGGEHTVTWGVIKGFLDGGMNSLGISDIGVVQIDAHADLRHAYEGNVYSHASVMKRIVEKGVPLYQLGVRAYCEEEVAARKEFSVSYSDADYLVSHNVQNVILPDNFPDHVFFTLDIDGMDPSVFPATGTPVPGGLSWYQTLNIFESIAKQKKIIGFDIMEFAPINGFHAYDFAAALLTYKMMGIVERNQ